MSGTELKTRINDALKTAMRAKEKARVAVLRMVLSEFKRIEVDERTEVDDARALAVLDKMQKQRRDSEQQYRDAGRTELADQEAYEISVIQQFLPTPLSGEELDELIAEAITQTNAQGMRAMGQVMGQLKPQVQGRADMAEVSRRLKAKLNG